MDSMVKERNEAKNRDKYRKDGILLGVELSGTSKSALLSLVRSSLKNKSKFFITTPNPEIIVKAQKDTDLMDALNASSIAIPDGVGVTLLAGLLGMKLKRIPGRVAMHWILEYANENKLSVFFLGSTKEVMDTVLLKINKDYPKVKANGSSDIVINNKGQSEIDRDTKQYIEIVKHINNYKPDILFVALGAPKQEKWIYSNLPKLNVGGAMTVGGSLDYYAGRMALPPGVVSRLGLEWLWRLCLEPNRFRRIANALLVFPYLVFWDQFSKMRSRQ